MLHLTNAPVLWPVVYLTSPALKLSEVCNLQELQDHKQVTTRVVQVKHVREFFLAKQYRSLKIVPKDIQSAHSFAKLMTKCWCIIHKCKWVSLEQLASYLKKTLWTFFAIAIANFWDLN
jgi:hypothetical protein